MLEINKFNKIITANWKLNGTFEFIETYFKNIHSKVSIEANVCGIICPPSIYIQNCSSIISPLYLGAQDCSKYESGPYTGEVSATMLKDNNCNFCIVGHSERREIFKIKDKDVNKKSEILINKGIIPIVCIGETLEEKNAGLTKNILKKQVINSLPTNASINSVIIAYEPIWSIGTGMTPTYEEISNIHLFIKKDIQNYENYKILYGGSVKSNNAKDIMNLENVDGVLVGGSSLDSLEFVKILNS